MKKLVLGAAVVAAFAGSFAHAEEAKPEEKKPDNEFTYNVALSTDYRFRGISQSRLDPALSGGADYVNNPTGLYVGTWISTIQWIKDLGGRSNFEFDVYAGKRGDLIKDVSYDVGVLTYYYASNNLQPNANTTEIYGQLGYGPAYLKYSHTLTNAFGAPNSKNSGYIDLGANIEAPNGMVLNLHVGHQTVKGPSDASYSDYKVGLTKDFGIVTGAIAIIGANTKSGGYYSTPNISNLGRAGLVASISKTF